MLHDSHRTTPFRLSGDFDLATASARADELRRHAATTESRLLEVDCTELEFVDSSGMSALVCVQNELTALNRRVVLTNLAPNVRTVLGITGLLDSFTSGIRSSTEAHP